MNKLAKSLSVILVLGAISLVLSPSSPEAFMIHACVIMLAATGLWWRRVYEPVLLVAGIPFSADVCFIPIFLLDPVFRMSSTGYGILSTSINSLLALLSALMVLSRFKEKKEDEQQV